MNNLIEWDYDKSVRIVSEKVGQLKLVTIKKTTLTDEIATELYEARRQLDARGRNQYSDVPNGTTRTWRGYLEEIGIAKSTVHRWLDHYEPTEQRLLSDDEYQAKKAAQRREQMEKEQANRDRVSQAVKTKQRPNDWNDDAEELYQKRLKDDAERDERIRKAKAEQERIAQARKAKYEPDDAIDELLEQAAEKHRQRQEFASKIGLSGDNAGHGFNDVLQDYLASLSDDSQRLEACHNIIKICRGVVSRLQQASVS